MICRIKCFQVLRYSSSLNNNSSILLEPGEIWGSSAPFSRQTSDAAVQAMHLHNSCASDVPAW